MKAVGDSDYRLGSLDLLEFDLSAENLLASLLLLPSLAGEL